MPAKKSNKKVQKPEVVLNSFYCVKEKQPVEGQVSHIGLSKNGRYQLKAVCSCGGKLNSNVSRDKATDIAIKLKLDLCELKLNVILSDLKHVKINIPERSEVVPERGEHSEEVTVEEVTDEDENHA
jgi:hypothetical protein